MKSYLREYGLIVVVIVLGVVGYAIIRENRSELLTNSLDTVRSRLVEMIDDVAGREAVAKHFDEFQEKVMAQEVPPEEVENIAANVLNLSNSGSTLTPEQAALILEFASTPAEVTLLPMPAAPSDTTLPPLVEAAPRPPTPPAPPAPVEAADLDALADRLGSMIAFDVEVHEAMPDRREMARHIRYRVDEGLHIDIDPEVAEVMKQRLPSEVERLEKQKIIVWKRNMAEEMRAERERARHELRSVTALIKKPPREVRMAMRQLESLKHLETLGYRPLLSDSARQEIKVHLEVALTRLSEDLEIVLVDQEGRIDVHVEAVEELLEQIEDSLDDLEDELEELEEEDEDDDDNG